MNKKLKVLITNHNLSDRAGTQLYVRDLALELQKMGHLPFIYSPILGEIAQEIRKSAIPVVSDLATLTIQPDIIHGHHHLETLAALLHFPSTPAIFVCHGWFPWQEAPPQFPRILRYLAIDQLTHQRLVIEGGISENQVRYFFNFVDLERFKPRPSLSTYPRKALVYSNYIEKSGSSFKIIQQACKQAGLKVDIVGLKAGNSTSHPEILLSDYDIVFAVGRSAIEALATGAAVIICSGGKIGKMVTIQNVEQLRSENFGLQALGHQSNIQNIVEEIHKYDAHQAKLVCEYVHASSGKSQAVNALVELYQEIIQTPLKVDAIQELQTLGRYLHHFSREFQSEMKKIKLEREKMSHMIDLYHFLLKIPFVESLCRKLKKKVIG
jgi:hypothetical protein